jgi:energy-coupling factor transporter ATP-binding protein EcfA2
VKRALAFRELVVRRMPGFPGGGPRLEELSPGINLVHGPNASGKTTAAAALQGLLWPRGAPESAGLEGRFDLGGEAWRVDVESRLPSWQRDGHDSAPPPLPPADDRDRYLLSLHGLLHAHDRDLAERIRVESAGGYDVRAAADALGFGASGRPRNLLDALTAAHDQLEAAREREAELRAEAARLERMREERQGVETAARRLEPLRCALALARAADRVAGAERALAAFPEALARLRGDELDRLDEWGRAREAADRAVATAEADVARTSAELEAAGLGEDGVPGSLLAETEARLDAIRRLDGDIARVRDARADARGRRQRAGAALGMDPGREEVGGIEAGHADRLDRFLRRAESLRARRAAIEERIRILTAAAADAEPRGDGAAGNPAQGEDAAQGSPAGGADDAAQASPAARAEAASQAVRVLRGWLRIGARDQDAERRVRALLAGAIGILGAAGLAAVVAGPALLASAAVTTTGILLLVAALALMLLRPAPEADGRAALERQAQRLGHSLPRWTADAVERLLDHLEDRLAAERVAAERRTEAERLAAELADLAPAEAALDQERATLAAELGIDPAPEDLTLHALATRLADLETARSDEAAADELLGEVGARRAAAIAEAAAALGPYGYEPADADAIAGALTDLRDRRERHQAASSAHTAARKAGERAAAERDDLAARRAALFAGLDLEVTQEPELRAWCDQLEAFRDARSELELARRERSAANADLGDDRPFDLSFDLPPDLSLGLSLDSSPDLPSDPPPDLSPDLPAGLSVADLEGAVRDAEAAAASEQELATAMAAIEARLADARRKHDVEEALAGVAAARAELADRRSEDVAAEVGAALVDWLGEQDRDRNRPAVFHRARDLFGLITRGRYRLDMTDGDRVAFRAFDNTSHRGHALDELSSGTRLQLLLAVRVAFVESQESGAALPLLLDEVLANCDDDRAAAIIDAALALARDGRQIFYFTAQADELVKWKSRLEAQDDTGEGRVDWCVRGIMDDVAGERDVAIEWPSAARPEVPAPHGMAHAAYGRALRVPPFDPWAEGVGGLHLWYLVDDVDALHQLLCLGVSRWGQLEYLASAAQDSALPGGMREVVDEARRAAALCDRFRQLWRQGRGRPVDRLALAESGAITDTFMEPVAALCEEVKGRAGALIEALGERRVPRFQAAKTEELRGYLHAAGYLTDEEPLSPDEIRVRLLADAGGAEAGAVDALIARLVGRP